MDEQHTEWLTKSEAAQLARVSERTLMRWAEHGRLSVYRTPSKRPRFDRAEVNALIQPDPRGPRTTATL